VISNLTTIRLRQDLIARPLDRRVAQVSLNADNTKAGQCMEGTPRLFDRIARGYPQRIDQPDKEASVDALMFLREDHKSVLGMLEMLDKAPTGSGAHSSGLLTMVTNLVIAESQHEAIEEQFFWPAVREALDNGDELADQAITQEQEGKKLLQRLHDGAPGDPDYHDALQEFVKVGREHIMYEQDVVWPAFEAAVSREDREKIGDKLEAAKKVAPTRPHPDTPPNATVQKTMGAGAAIVDHLRDAVSGREADNPPDPQTK
jgi:hemerythrin-like domain-containing protein